MLHSFSNTFSLAHILQTLPNRVLIEFDCWWFLKQCQIIILKAPQKGHQVQRRMTTCQLSDSYPTVHSQTVRRWEMLGHCANPRRPSHCIVPLAVRDGPQVTADHSRAVRSGWTTGNRTTIDRMLPQPWSKYEQMEPREPIITKIKS